MVNRIVLIIGFVFLLLSCANKDNLNISGELTNAKSKVVYLQKLTLDEAITIDSLELKEKGKFEFKLPKQEFPTFYLLKFSEKNFITLLADTTEQIKIIADANDLTKTYTVKNSLGSSYVKVLNTKLEKTKAAVDSLAVLYKDAKENDKEKRDELRDEIIQVVEKQKDFIRDFVMANPRSFASYYAVFQRFDDGSLVLNPRVKEELNLYSAVATSLDLFYKGSPRSAQLKNFVLGIQKNKQLEALQKKLESTDGISFLEIEEENLQGKKIKLSSLKGKMVLLSFWASWDENSRKENKNLLTTYNKYKSKGFEVYQVSLDKSKILWEGAVKEDKLPWINVSDLNYTNSYPARLYNVQKLPANYLLDRDGELIGKNLFGRILDEKLNDLLN